jgi:hypothetical protein
VRAAIVGSSKAVEAKVEAERDLAIAADLMAETGARIYEATLNRVRDQIQSEGPNRSIQAG